MDKADRTLRLTPIVRFAMSFGEEIRLAQPNTYTGTVERLVNRTDDIKRRLSEQLKTLVVLDLLLVAFAAGATTDFQLYGIKLSSFSFLFESILIIETITFYFAAISQVNESAYSMMLRTAVDAIVSDPEADSEFLLETYSFQELFLRIFRPQLNIRNRQIFDSGAGFLTASRLVLWGSYAMLGVIGLIQVAIVIWSCTQIVIHSKLGVLVDLPCVAFALSVHAFSIIIVILINVSFDFEIATTMPSDL